VYREYNRFETFTDERTVSYGKPGSLKKGPKESVIEDNSPELKSGLKLQCTARFGSILTNKGKYLLPFTNI